MEFQELFATFLMGLGAILALVLTIALSGVMLAWSAKARRTLSVIDSNPALLAFGNTATGQYLHGQLQGLLPLIDQPNDKAIQDLLNVPILKKLHAQGIIDDKALSKGLSHFLGLTIDLLDGRSANHLMEKDIMSGRGLPIASSPEGSFQERLANAGHSLSAQVPRQFYESPPSANIKEDPDARG